jgi:hypothetical protein
VLAEELTKAGGIVEQVVVYESLDVERPDFAIVEQMAAGRIDWTTVTSSAIARSLAHLFGIRSGERSLSASARSPAPRSVNWVSEPAAEGKRIHDCRRSRGDTIGPTAAVAGAR